MSNQWQGGKGDRNRIENLKAWRKNYDKVFGKKEPEEREKPLTQVQIDRRLKEWKTMYDFLDNICLYEYPIQEAKELIKKIKSS